MRSGLSRLPEGVTVMVGHRVQLRVNAYEDEDLELTFPGDWEVVECRMLGHGRPPLTDEQIRSAIQSPIESPRLREIAKGKERVVILFDDPTKPTPTHRIVPFFLEELREGGIRDDQIRFVCGFGAHRALSTREFVTKLGADVVANYPVYNHNPYENVVYVGTTSRGTPMYINREVVSCDLRIAIGGIIPHRLAGFGAGGKIVLPGVAGIETIAAHHSRMVQEPYRETIGVGKVDGNHFRLDIEEGARLGGLQFKADCVINDRREVVGVCAGDVVAEHRAGVRLAREVYHTELVGDADVLVSNAYPDEHQVMRAFRLSPLCLKDGGDLVVVGWNREGQAVHYLNGRFGTEYGGRGWRSGRTSEALARVGSVFVLTPLLSMTERMEFGGNNVVWCRSWGEVIAKLAARHGPGTRAVVYPYAPIQLVTKRA